MESNDIPDIPDRGGGEREIPGLPLGEVGNRAQLGQSEALVTVTVPRIGRAQGFAFVTLNLLSVIVSKISYSVLYLTTQIPDN